MKINFGTNVTILFSLPSRGSELCELYEFLRQNLNLHPHLLLRMPGALQWANPNHESKYIACCKWFLLIQKRFWPWQDLNLHPHGGSRTRNLLLRRLAPYPLGHMVLFQWATRPSNKPRQMQTMEMSLLQHSLQTRWIKQWSRIKTGNGLPKEPHFVIISKISIPRKYLLEDNNDPLI